MTGFEFYKQRLNECLENGDQEIAHIEADDILCEIALNTTLSAEERNELIALYRKVEKWFA